MRPTLALAALMLLACPFAHDVRAASLEVNPVLITLAAGQTATTIEVTNHGAAPTAIQARAYHWAQAGDDDTLAPTQDVIVSPPIFTVPGGGSQTMRLLLRGVGTTVGDERTYRLLLDEVPAANTLNRQISFTMRLSLPVFVGGAASARPKLQWRVDHAASGQTVLTVTNTGSAYDRLRAIDVTLANGSHPKVVSRSTTPYVLPGAERHWVVQDHGSGPGGPLRLSVISLTGKSEQTLTP
jgi:fimbrial chaperone protein